MPVDEWDEMEATPTPEVDMNTTQEFAGQRRVQTAPMGIPQQQGAVPVAPFSDHYSSSYHGSPPSGGPPPPDDTLGKAARSLVVICAGIATVGAVFWFLATNFLVTRKEFTDERGMRDRLHEASNGQSNESRDRIEKLEKKVEEQRLQIEVLNKDFAVMKALSRKGY
jgi:hypothetical protein